MALGEFALIDKYFSRLGADRADVHLGVGDDGAILAPPAGMDLVAVADMMVEGRHFPPGSTAHSIGHRVLAVNLSDIAAMGAQPAWALLSISLPSVDEQWLAEFAEGFATLAKAHGVALVGGDTTAGPLTLSVQVMGFLRTGAGLRRSGGRPGDWVYVSGTLGDAAAGLATTVLAARDLAARDLASISALRQRFEYPTPRVALGQQLLGLASACIDVSDGLLGDLGKLAAASGCSAEIDLNSLPRSPALRQAVVDTVFSQAEADSFMLAGGDDYELLFTLPDTPAVRESQALHTALARGEITRIGRLIEGDSSTIDLLENGHKRSVQPAGYDHFKRAR